MTSARFGVFGHGWGRDEMNQIEPLRTGFTLIELLVVIAIMGVLVGV
jgi:prepilin-type N-terminal cleavage/methylation domain-containing protein